VASVDSGSPVLGTSAGRGLFFSFFCLLRLLMLSGHCRHCLATAAVLG
jgi:hypothetical protein